MKSKFIEREALRNKLIDTTNARNLPLFPVALDMFDLAWELGSEYGDVIVEKRFMELLHLVETTWRIAIELKDNQNYFSI